MKNIKISSIKPNPKNPRTISPESLEKLKKSITEFPRMMELRPIIVDSESVIVGGNMRYQALAALGYEEIPSTWIKNASDFSEKELNRFIVVDNLPFGEWEYSELSAGWDVDDLVSWGFNSDSLSPSSKKVKDRDGAEFDSVQIKILYVDTADWILWKNKITNFLGENNITFRLD